MTIPTAVIIFGAKYLIFISAFIAAVYFLLQPRAKQKELIIFGAVTLPITYVVALIAGLLYYNPRPFATGHFLPLLPHHNNNGFPSDHALASAAIAVVIFRSNKKFGVVLFIVALVVGISRVLAGVHHTIDIIASLMIAVVIGWLSDRFILPVVKKYFLKQYEPKIDSTF